MRGSHVCIPELFHIIWFWGVGGYAVSQSVLHHLLLFKACSQCVPMYFEGPKETRGSHVGIPELFHIIWFWEGYAVSWSVLHNFLSLKACFQCIPVSFEGPEETSGACHSVLKLSGFWGVMLYLSKFSTVFYC